MDQHPATTFHLKQTKTPQNKTKLRNESLLARYFGVEAAETNSKRLKSRDWILIIHGEYVFSHFPELEDDIILLLLSPTTTTGPIVLKGRWWCNELKVLHWSHSNPSIEVEAPALELLVPPGSLVFQNQQLVLLCCWWTCPKSETIHTCWFWSEKREWGKWIQVPRQEFGLSGGHTSRFDWWSGYGVHDALHPPWAPVSHMYLNC